MPVEKVKSCRIKLLKNPLNNPCSTACMALCKVLLKVGKKEIYIYKMKRIYIKDNI